ncbi:MAG: PIN domain-containing protein [Armatimonadota bacterium]
MDRVFLDANILFSAAYRPESSIRRLWDLPALTLVSSLYAIEEARRNLQVHMPLHLSVLDSLLEHMEIVPGSSPITRLPSHIVLADKDAPILAAAIAARCTALLTGDKQHFSELFGKVVEGVTILTPAEYMRQLR